LSISGVVKDHLKYDFLGFTIKPSMETIKGKGMLLPGTFVNV
jgi:hypothetical protein